MDPRPQQEKGSGGEEKEEPVFGQIWSCDERPRERGRGIVMRSGAPWEVRSLWEVTALLTQDLNFVLLSMGKCPLGTWDGFAGVPLVATGKNQIAAVLPVLHLFFIIHPPRN